MYTYTYIHTKRSSWTSFPPPSHPSRSPQRTQLMGMQFLRSVYLASTLSLQLRPTLCGPIDFSSSGSSVPGILQEEYWSGSPYSSPEDLPNPGNKSGTPEPPALQADSLALRHQESTLCSLHDYLKPVRSPFYIKGYFPLYKGE